MIPRPRRKAPLLKGTLVGLAATILLYLIPGVNLVSPLIGGAIGGYLVNLGLWGGVRSGALLALFILIPGMALEILAGLIRGQIEVPFFRWDGGSASLILHLVLIAHTAVLGVFGGVMGGALAKTSPKHL
jgi:hypothetical protein